MPTIPGTMQDGKIILDAPANVPEGSRVLVLLEEPEAPTLGIREEDWPTTEQEMAAWLDWFDKCEPVEMTPAEEEELQQAREAVRQVTLAAVKRRMESDE